MPGAWVQYLIAQFSFPMSNHALWQVDENRTLICIADADLKSKIANRKSKTGWGCSSVGRAVALQAIGQEFESPQLHQPSLAAKPERGCRAAAIAKAGQRG